jgi:hypothetical protein
METIMKPSRKENGALPYVPFPNKLVIVKTSILQNAAKAHTAPIAANRKSQRSRFNRQRPHGQLLSFPRKMHHAAEQSSLSSGRAGTLAHQQHTTECKAG